MAGLSISAPARPWRESPWLRLWYVTRTGALEYYVTVPFHYNFIFCLTTGALGLFMAFGGLRIRSEKLERCICRLSPGMFGVYLIHEHMDISAKVDRLDYRDAVGASGRLSDADDRERTACVPSCSGN